MKMEQTECSETSGYKIHTPGNYPEESIQHSEHGESFKSRKPKLHTHREYALRFYPLLHTYIGDRGSTVIKVLCYKSEGRWFDPSWCHCIFH